MVEKNETKAYFLHLMSFFEMLEKVKKKKRFVKTTIVHNCRQSCNCNDDFASIAQLGTQF